MTPPEAPVRDAGNTPPAVSVCLRGLKRRSEFLTLNRARRQAAGTMLVQGRARGDGDASIGVGITCSKKLGNAVTRNRAKRRLRAAARAVLPGHGQPGWDYALIGRPGVTVEADFNRLKSDLVSALRKLHGDA